MPLQRIDARELERVAKPARALRSANQWRSVDGTAFRAARDYGGCCERFGGSTNVLRTGGDIVPTHVFRPRTGAQGAQRDAGGRVRIDDGGSNDLRLLRRPPSSTTTPATRSARPWDPSTSRDTPTVSGSFSVPETRFFRRRENAAVARSFWPDRRVWSCRRARGPLERRKRLPWRRVSVGFGWISSRDRTNAIRSLQHPHGWA